jgi:Zn-dependent protease/predicted transcriptional regulator
MNRPNASPWSLTVARIAGIPIRLHFTLILFLAWIGFVGVRNDAAGAFSLAVGIFLSVLLHELGHALTAKRFGVQTRDITLYPIGGVAVLEGKKPKAWEELWIALAGPAVNLAILALLSPILLSTKGALPSFAGGLEGKTLMEGLWLGNAAMALFNMVPAFPMDGGRVLRALLAITKGEPIASQVAGSVGQFLAIVIGLVGLLNGNVVLMLIAFFVFLGAGQEINATMQAGYTQDRLVGDAMMTEFQTLSSGSTLDDAAKLLLSTSQQDFPVVFGNEVLGILSRMDIAKGLAEHGPGGYVSGAMQREFRTLGPGEPLERAIEMFASSRSPILVLKGTDLVGLLTAENLSEFLMLEHAKSIRRRANA